MQRTAQHIAFMASPQYSTPYSQLSYPSYTPLSVMPVKSADSPWPGSSSGHNYNATTNKNNGSYHAFSPQQQEQLQRRPLHGGESDLRLLRAAVQHDVAQQQKNNTTAAASTAGLSQAAHAESSHVVLGPGWPAPDTANAQRRSAGFSALVTPSTRTNAPLYAPPLPQQIHQHPQQHQHLLQPPPQHQQQQPTSSSIRYSDIDRVRSVPAAALPQRVSPPFTSSGPTTVGGVDVDVQSDVVRASEAAPYLCAFQEECQSLLALLSAPPPQLPAQPWRSPSPETAATALESVGLPARLPPSPYQLAGAQPQSHHAQQRPTHEGSTTLSHTASPDLVRAMANLRPAPMAPSYAGTEATSQQTPASTPPPAAVKAATSPAESLPSLHASLSPVAAAPATEGVMDASAAHPASTTYAQLLQEMDELASLLEHEDTASSNHTSESTANESQPQEQASLPPPPAPSRPASKAPSQSPADVTASPAATSERERETPEKVKRPPPPPPSSSGRQSRHSSEPQQVRPQQPPSRSRLAPSPAMLVTHVPSSFWAAQLLKWIVFLVDKKQRVLRYIQAFESARTPQRRDGAATASAAGAATATGTPTSAAPGPGGESAGVDAAPAEEAAAVAVADALLELLRSLRSPEGDGEGWTAPGPQQRHVCTRVANKLAELTAAEEAVVAGLLNDAAAGATLEREVGPSGRQSGLVATPQTTLAPALHAAPAAALPPEYRRDMLETIALLEKISQENAGLKRQVADTQDELKTLRREVRGERDAKNEVAAHFDRVAAQNTELAGRLRDAEARLHAAEKEAATRPAPQDDALRDQLDRQTGHLRDVRRELDDAKAESDTLRRTVLQLRDAVVRHRAVIDLLTRHRRGRQQSGGAGQPSGTGPTDSPPMQLIEDILSGVCDAPSTTATSLSNSVAVEEDEEGGLLEDEADGPYSGSDVDSSEMYYV